MSLNVPGGGDNVPQIKLPRDNVASPQCLSGQHPSAQCPSGQLSLATMFLLTIAPRDKCSSIPLQMVICKEGGPLDAQNQGDGGAWIVANNYPDDLASSVLLCSFANGHLQRGRFSG